MTKLLELTKDFKVSRPVFHLQLSGDNIYITTKQDSAYQYKPKPSADPLSQLVCACYGETFDSRVGEYYIIKEDIAKRAMREIRGSVTKFIESNVGMRNPRQSKLYRWAYRNMPADSEFNDTLVMVYKYIRSFTNLDMKSNNVDHINNAIALLEAIMRKHEQ